MGYSAWGGKDLDTTEQMTLSLWASLMAQAVKHPPAMQERRRQWHPTPVLLPGKSHERRSLIDCSPQGR